jgi:hypothetical protein
MRRRGTLAALALAALAGAALLGLRRLRAPVWHDVPEPRE